MAPFHRTAMSGRRAPRSSASFNPPRRIFLLPFSRIVAIAFFVLLLPNNADAYAFYGPSNSLTPQTQPEAIVEWQLASLKADDLQQTFQYSSPANRAITGPWTRFAAMVRTPAYVDLINHARSEIVMTVHTPDDQRWRCLVRIWPQNDPRGEPKEYWWALSRTKEEKGTVDGFRNGGFVPAETEIFAGCFMVDAVVPNRLLGEIDQRNAEMASKGVVKLNVGGTRYEVAISLLEAHSNTMVARMVSKDWQQRNTAEEEIFIERDGARFKYFLDYLRDGKVSLPLSVSKKAVIDDLKYFGIDAEDRVSYDEVEVPDVNSLFLNTMTSSEKALEDLTAEENGLTEEIERVEDELVGLKERKLEASNRIQVFRCARIIYESIISTVIKCEPPGFPSSVSIYFSWSSNACKDRQLKFLAQNQEDYFDILKAYLNASFGVELICMKVPTKELFLEFIVKSGQNREE